MKTTGMKTTGMKTTGMKKFTSSLPRKLGHRRGRAWLDCIINPYIHAIRRLLEENYLESVLKVRVQSIIAIGHTPKLIQIECPDKDNMGLRTTSATFAWRIHDAASLENIEDIYYSVPSFIDAEERFIFALLHDRRISITKARESITEFLNYLTELRQAMATRYDLPFYSQQQSIFA